MRSLSEVIELTVVIARSGSDEAIQLLFLRFRIASLKIVIEPATSGRTRWLAMTN